MTDAQKALALQTWEHCKDVSQNIWTLKPSPEYAHATAMMMLGIIAHESDGFRARRQYGFSPNSDGGAFGLPQMERAAIENGLKQIKNSVALEDKVSAMVLWGVNTTFRDVANAIQRPEGDLMGIILMRLYLLRCPGANPLTVYGQAQFWKKYWNTVAGAGTVAQYLNNWERYCKEIVEADAG